MLEKHNLLGSSLNRLNISFAATNGGTEVPSVILDRAPRTMADEDNASWESTMQSNNTPGSKQSVVDFTNLSESIKSLGDRATEAAEIQAEELQKNRVHESQVLQKTHRHESQEREKIHQHEVLQREKTLKHEALEKKGIVTIRKNRRLVIVLQSSDRRSANFNRNCFCISRTTFQTKRKRK
jgi:hypothetical protein